MNNDYILISILLIGIIYLNKEFIQAELFTREDEDNRT